MKFHKAWGLCEVNNWKQSNKIKGSYTAAFEHSQP